jgi:uncharacterized membrane protein required for colicin V production
MINLETYISNFIAIDYLILSLSVFVIFFSTWKGFVNSILGMLTWVGAVLISIYLHQYLSELIISQLSKSELIAKNLPINSISKYILAIPIVFFISLYFLKKFRKLLTSDLDKTFIESLLDKIFGLIFGIAFTYIILSTIVISPTLIKFSWYNENIISPLNNKSQIMQTVVKINSGITPPTKDLIEIID